MAEGVNVRFPEKLMQFVEQRTEGVYGSTSEYIRDLVRKDYEAEEARRWEMLKEELLSGLNAPDSEFLPVTAEEIIRRNRQ